MNLGERQRNISVFNTPSYLNLDSSLFSSRNLEFQKRSPNVSDVNAVRHSDTPLPIYPGRGLYSWTAVRWRSSTAASRMSEASASEHAQESSIPDKRGRQLFPYRPILRIKRVIEGLV